MAEPQQQQQQQQQGESEGEGEGKREKEMAVRCSSCCSVRRVGCLLLVLTPLLNLQYLFLGRDFSMAFLSSPCFAYLNLPVVALISGLMRAQGVPVGGNRTEEYARTPSGRSLLVDV